MNKKTLYISVIVFLIVVGGLFFLLNNKNRRKGIETDSQISDLESSDVVVSTDKTEYNKGEIIKVTIKNNLATSILYSKDGDRFWDVEYFENGEWTNSDHAAIGGGFQLTEEDVGEDCYILFYERGFPVELKPGETLSDQWNQKICPYKSSPYKPSTVTLAKSGQYRFTFTYGFEISSDDPFRISDPKIVYSNSFTIR